MAELHDWAPIPLSVITGFLGSGKTTLLNRLLRDPAMAGCAVLVNEFGEVGIDHLLVQPLTETVVLLDNGCLCCAVRTDLVDALRSLSIQRLRGEIPPFRRVVVETTGLADPVPVVHTLITDPLPLERYALDGMVTTIDACHGEAQLRTQPEAVKQAVMADRLVLTKLDLRGDDAPALRARLRALNPGATLFPAPDATAARLFDTGPYNPAAKGAELLLWLADAEAGGVHESDVDTLCLSTDVPLDWPAVSAFLTELLAQHGASVLRTKGVLNIAGRDLPLVINGVQHVFHPAIELPAWPAGPRRSQLVFITRDLPRAAIATPFRQRFGSSRPGR